MKKLQNERVRHVLVHILGWSATVLHGDPSSFDRWVWLKHHLLPGPLRTLDAGCGSGAYTMYAAKIGNESIGISSDGRNNDAARARASMLRIPNVQFIQADLRNLDREAVALGTFDQIICLETLEHILNDRKLLADLSRLLNAGGRLLLTAPFKGHKPLLGEVLSQAEDGGHVRWGYTHQEVARLFDECGLEAVSQEFISGFVTQQLMNLTRILSKVHAKFAWAATFPLRLFQILDGSLTELLRYPYLSIGVVGIKRKSE